MNKASIYLFLMIGCMSLFVSCEKQDENLVLDAGYLNVADVLEYCQGSCDGTLAWEGNEVLIKGNIPDIENEAVMLSYFQEGRYYLHDIRNGMFIEIRIAGDDDAIFQLLSGHEKLDKIYVTGTLEPVIVNHDNECTKGVVIILDDARHIKINL